MILGRYSVADVKQSISPKDLFVMVEKSEAASRNAATNQGVKAMLACKCGAHGVILDEDVGDGNVTCPGCQVSYCIECGDTTHSGACLPPAETLAWLSKLTKQCPKCKVVIEKNQVRELAWIVSCTAYIVGM